MLRTSLSLSAWLGVPFAISGIRIKRPKPGLKPQHLTALLAAAEITHAEVKGAAIGSTEVTFVPGSPSRTVLLRRIQGRQFGWFGHAHPADPPARAGEMRRTLQPSHRRWHARHVEPAISLHRSLLPVLIIEDGSSHDARYKQVGVLSEGRRRDRGGNISRDACSGGTHRQGQPPRP